MDLVGFGDASEKAYGACLYAVSYDRNGRVTSHLICSKARVALLKVISLPRLELYAALLLVELLNLVKRACQGNINGVYLWSDSTITLEWIKTPPNQLKTFVANRVAKIQELSPKACWNHVPSEDNSADLLFRGITTEQLKRSKLWWEGPEWIKSKQLWPQQPNLSKVDISERKTVVSAATSYAPPEFLIKYSSYHKLRRIVAFCHRFIANLKERRKIGSLSLEELNKAETSILRIIQQEAFAQEIKDLKLLLPISKASKLAKINDQGIIRIGGRLRNADLTPDHKHQIVLPARHRIVNLIFREEHVMRLHCGPEQLLSFVQQKYWPLNGRREAKKITQSCVRCFNYKPRTPDVRMADLPKTKVTATSRPFTVTGIDYAGPFQMKESRRRGRVHVAKAYVAVFVCFSTRTVHLELVTALTTEAFLAALRRFVARKGICSQLYSDNATNFVGAARELREVYDFLANKEDEISNELATRKIKWKFIPPRSPHFEELWEAAVKAMKRHLNTRGLALTYEEYNTLLVEIEAVLNSRPLTPLSSNSNDLLALTPTHFLIGNSLSEPVQNNFVDVPENRLSRWQHLQKIRQHFWKRWHREYLQTLQTRSKWFSGQKSVEPGDMVLMKDDNLPPLNWKLGRVTETFPGDDGIVRVATVKTSVGAFKRPIKKLCPLPISDYKLCIN
nr:PREDICTED: uncharacterized protein LOC105680081 [Linepithema humile]